MGIIPQLYTLSHTPDSLFNTNFCKARGYITQYSVMLCRWLLTIACIDRCLLSSTGARLRFFSTIHTARKIGIFLSMIWLIIPVHMIIFAVVRVPGYITCMMATSGAAFYHSIYAIIVGGLFPPLIMLICTKIIWKNVQIKRQRRRIINLNRRERCDTQVLLQVIIFIVFTIPYMSFNLYLAITRTVTNKSSDRLAIEAFLQLFTEIIVYVSPVSSFYSNTLASQTFRNDLIILLCRILTCVHLQRFRHRQTISPSTITATYTKRNELPIIVTN